MNINYDDYLWAQADNFFNSPTLEELEELEDMEDNRQFDEYHENWIEYDDRRAELFNFNT